MILTIDDMPSDTRLCPVLSANKIKTVSTNIDGFPGSPEATEPLPSKALVNACWRMVKACMRDDGIGLAAPQLGMFKKMFIIREDESNAFRVYFHPSYTIAIESKVVTDYEGCLSVPGPARLVPRASIIEASWYEIEAYTGKIIEKKEVWSEHRARVFQHEFDHLNGISILDKGIAAPK